MLLFNVIKLSCKFVLCAHFADLVGRETPETKFYKSKEYHIMVRILLRWVSRRTVVVTSAVVAASWKKTKIWASDTPYEENRIPLWRCPRWEPKVSGALDNKQVGGGGYYNLGRTP